MATPKTGSVYALIDPRDGSVRYIGKTTQALLDRLGGHLATPTNPAMRVWINALGSQGLVPRIELVATASATGLDAEEKRQIQRHAENGHRLLNSPYYHRNLADVFTASANAAAPMVKKKGGNTGEEFARRMYGPIAAGRASGRLPRWAAAILILLRVPVVALAYIWFAASSMPGFRSIARIGVIATYLWTIGFDRLAKDKAVPYLPVAELTRFWNAYLAGPLHTLGWHVLGMAFLTAWIAYIPVAEAAGVPPIGAPNQRPQRFDPSGIAIKPLPPGADAVDVAAAAAAALDRAILQPQQPGRP
jgi:hypothetical protein